MILYRQVSWIEEISPAALELIIIDRPTGHGTRICRWCCCLPAEELRGKSGVFPTSTPKAQRRNQKNCTYQVTPSWLLLLSSSSSSLSTSITRLCIQLRRWHANRMESRDNLLYGLVSELMVLHISFHWHEREIFRCCSSSNMWQRFGLQSSRHPFALSRVAKEQRQLLLLKHDQVNVVVGIKEVQYIV